MAWHGMWADEQPRKRILRAAGAKLLKPKLVASYGYWRRGWEAEEAEKGRMSIAQRLKQAQDDKNAMQEQLAGVITTLRQELAEAREAMLDGRGLEAEMQRQLDEKLRLEKEKRIEHLKNSAMRRIQNQGLLKGWGAWFEMWEEQVRKKRMLAGAAARMSKPALTACFSHWRHDWEGEQRALVEAAAKKRLDEQLKQSSSVQQVKIGTTPTWV